MSSVTFITGGPMRKLGMRKANERLVLNLIRQNPSISRADICRRTGLSASSITYIVKRLKHERLLHEDEPVNRAQVGRQPAGLRLRADAKVAVGVEIAATGAQIVMVGLDDSILNRTTVDWDLNTESFFAKVHAAVRKLVDPLRAGRLLGVGVALPGTIERTEGKVVAAENLGWFDVPAGKLLRQELTTPFYFDNGAKLSAIAEMWAADREGSPLRDFVSVIARGGVGTGVMVNGQILRGASSAAGEFGHISLYPDGRPCPCGNIGCWEQYASDLALVRAYAEESTNDDGVAVSAEGIIIKARAGDPAALRAVEYTARHLGLGFVNLIMSLNPQAIFVGDYVADAWDLMQDSVWSVLRSRVPAYELVGLRIVPSHYGAESPVMGAVALVLSRFFNSFDQGSRTKPVTELSFLAMA